MAAPHQDVDGVPIAACAMTCFAVGQDIAIGGGDDTGNALGVVAACARRKQVNLLPDDHRYLSHADAVWLMSS